MDANFWYQRWAANEIGFHERTVNPLLVAYFNTLALAKGSRVFVPLCGKTLDIAWLLSHGYRVAGAELSELAIQQLFVALGLEPDITSLGEVKHYRATDIDIFVGDIFALTRTRLGSVDAVFDRAALVALPEALRRRYAKHVIELTDHAPQFLITYEYDQKLMDGPPFSVDTEEVRRHYTVSYQLSSLISLEVRGGLKGGCAAQEHVWLLQPLTTPSPQHENRGSV
jgi:thiopurine S-methyltransferase